MLISNPVYPKIDLKKLITKKKNRRPGEDSDEK